MTADESRRTSELEQALDRLVGSGRDELARQLAAIFTAVAAEAAQRGPFAKALERALAPAPDSRERTAASRPHRRNPGVLNPFAVYERGEAELRHALAALSVEQLKDVIAEHAMDRDKLAMKWKTPERLIDRIVETVKVRTQKGDVFRRQP